MSVGIEPVIPDHDLALVGDVGGHPGDELQIVHRLQLSCAFPISVADQALLLIEGEAFQGKERPDHVLSHRLGLVSGLGLDPTVDVEAGVRLDSDFDGYG